MNSDPSWLAGKISLDQLSRFCGNMGMCLSAGMTVLNSLRTCQRTFPFPVLKSILTGAIARVETGMELSEALEPWHRRFPSFFLPALRCGERSGRLDETLSYLEKHCALLAEPVKMMHKTWLVPLAIMLFGSALVTAAYFFFHSFSSAMRYAFSELMSYGKIAAVVLVVLYVPELKRLAQRIMLAMPLIGPVLRELAINRFFHAFNLLYIAGGMRVETMIRMAAESAGNAGLEEHLIRGVERIKQGETIAEVFSSMTVLPLEYRSLIATGDEAGKLETAFETICRRSSETLQSRLSVFHQIFFRVVGAVVVWSVCSTISGLLLLR